MKTPWGKLGDLNLADHELAAKILSADKHQLAEGLIVECLFDQIVVNISSGLQEDRGAIPLDVESVVVDTRRVTERWLCFVWARSRGEGLGRYLHILEKRFVPYLVTYSNGEFIAARIRNGRRERPERPLPELMLELSGGKVTPFEVDDLVRDHMRQQQAFWGFISGFYGEQLGNRVILPRIFINYAIQPYFRAVWNLDRIFIIENDVWLFEIKHKFPMDFEGLYFGINHGELVVLERLAESGIRCLHTILVKPYWSKELGSMYLLNNLNMRPQAAIIATVLDKAKTAHIRRQESGQSGSHTSINGSSKVSFKKMAASDFNVLGLLSDSPIDVAAKMLSTITKADSDPVQDAWLRSLRIKNT